MTSEEIALNWDLNDEREGSSRQKIWRKSVPSKQTIYMKVGRNWSGILEEQKAGK